MRVFWSPDLLTLIPVLRSQRRDQAQRVQQEVERGQDVRRDDVGGGQRFGRGALRADHGDAQGGGLQHEPVVAAIADRGDRLAPELNDVFELVHVLSDRVHDLDATGDAGQRGLRRAERVGRDDVDAEARRQRDQPLAHAREKRAVARQGAVVVQHEVVEPQGRVAGYGDFDHVYLAPSGARRRMRPTRRR